MKHINILDCTLRDGGYHANWQFSDAFVAIYIQVIKELEVDIVELGYCCGQMGNDKGRFARCTSEIISMLNLPKSVDYAVMLDAKSFFNINYKFNKFLSNAIGKRGDSFIDVVRIAVSYKELANAVPIIQQVVDLGHRVFLNLMQISTNDLDGLRKQCEGVSLLRDTVEVVYFADSFGRMTPYDIPDVTHAINSFWEGHVGFHGHNNKGLALLNAIEAIHEGVSWIDSTMCGMGRGAGNVSTEHLIREIDYDYDPDEHKCLTRLITEHLAPLREKYKWGANPYYMIAAEHNIHPMYIQQMMIELDMHKSDMLNAIAILKSIDATHFDQRTLDYCLSARSVLGG